MSKLEEEFDYETDLEH